MKTIAVDRDYQFKLKRHAHVQYRAGQIYERVPEVQAQTIVKAGAGRIVDERSES